jgi:hypothetical protein
VLLPALAALVILASVLALSPHARSAVASWFHIAGVRIESGTSAPGPLGHNLDLGRRVSLSEAQKRVGFPILVPALPGLGRPDEVYFGTPPSSGRVALVYGTRRGLARASTTGAGLLVMEARARFFLGKDLPYGTTEQVPIEGDEGVWIGGKLHIMYFIDRTGRPQLDTIRLAGNVLLWQRGAVMVRIEGRISMERAIAIAQSMEK